MYCAPCCRAMAVVMSGMVSLSSIPPTVRQDALDIGRHDLGGGAIDVFVEQRLIAGRLEIELDGARPALLAADMHDEAGGGIDLARGADRQEEAAALQRGVDL